MSLKEPKACLYIQTFVAENAASWTRGDWEHIWRIQQEQVSTV